MALPLHRALDMPTFQRRSQISVLVTMAVAVALSLPLPATAGAPTDSLKQAVDQVVKILSDPALKDKPTFDGRKSGRSPRASSTIPRPRAARWVSTGTAGHRRS